MIVSSSSSFSLQIVQHEQDKTKTYIRGIIKTKPVRKRESPSQRIQTPLIHHIPRTNPCTSAHHST